MKLVILDRDGVINRDSSDYIKSPQEWQAIPGSLEAIAKLNRAGCKVAVATNQSGVGRGYFNLAMLEKIHAKMLTELTAVGGFLDALAFCPHVPNDQCECRKPKPGLLLQIGQQLNIDLSEAVMIGDSLRDMEAAAAASAKAIFIGSDVIAPLKHIPVFSSLALAVQHICA